MTNCIHCSIELYGSTCSNNVPDHICDDCLAKEDGEA